MYPVGKKLKCQRTAGRVMVTLFWESQEQIVEHLSGMGCDDEQ
jgi:hypothetical protein